MLYQLPNGKCIEISAEQYSKMSDNDWDNMLKDLEAQNYGEELNDPFSISVLKYGFSSKKRSSYYDDEEYCIQEHEPDLTDIDSIDKMSDSDFIDIDNIEI